MLKDFFPVAWRYRLSNIKHALFGYSRYAQFGEDAVLLELFKDLPHGRYIDIGAHHPYRYSNTYLLYREGWRGINVDPNPRTIRQFMRARPDDKNLCVAVGKPHHARYYQFSDPAVNTFIEEEAKKWMAKPFVRFLGTRDVDLQPLSAIVDGPFDLLAIDVEGMDLEVLESYDWKYYPKVIVIEGTEAQPLLEAKGYSLYATRGLSRIFVRKPEPNV